MPLAICLLLIALAVTIGSLVCSPDLGRFISSTFRPLTKREFWFPECEFCWIARAAALSALFVIVGPYIW